VLYGLSRLNRNNTKGRPARSFYLSKTRGTLIREEISRPWSRHLTCGIISNLLQWRLNLQKISWPWLIGFRLRRAAYNISQPAKGCADTHASGDSVNEAVLHLRVTEVQLARSAEGKDLLETFSATLDTTTNNQALSPTLQPSTSLEAFTSGLEGLGEGQLCRS
jgi:hypothetical protein